MCVQSKKRNLYTGITWVICVIGRMMSSFGPLQKKNLERHEANQGLRFFLSSDSYGKPIKPGFICSTLAQSNEHDTSI